MRVISFSVFLFCFVVFFAEFKKNYLDFMEIYQKVENVSKEVDANLFIYESFEQTCRGEGFLSLIEWQKNCKNMFNLDYIGFSPVEEFMVLDRIQCGSFFYGCWFSEKCRGEIYCRSYI